MEKIFDALFEAKRALQQEREVHLAESLQDREMKWAEERRVLQEREMESVQTLQDREMQRAEERRVQQEREMELVQTLQDREMQWAEERRVLQEREMESAQTVQDKEMQWAEERRVLQEREMQWAEERRVQQEREMESAQTFQDREMQWAEERRVLQEREMESAQTLQDREMQWAKERRVLQEREMESAQTLQDREMQWAKERRVLQEREMESTQKFEEQKKATHEKQLEFARAAEEWSSREQLLLQLLQKKKTTELLFNIDESSSGLIPEPKITRVTGEDQIEVTQIELGMPAESVQSGDNFYHCIVTVQVGNSSQEGLNDPSETVGNIKEPQPPLEEQSTPPNSNKTKNMITEQEKPAAEVTDVVQDTQGHPVENQANKQAGTITDTNESLTENQDMAKNTQVEEEHTAILQTEDQIDCSVTESQADTAEDEGGITEVQGALDMETQSTATPPETPGTNVQENEVQSSWEATEHSSSEPKAKTEAEVEAATNTALGQTENQSDSSTVPADNPSDAQAETPEVQDTIIQGQDVLKTEEKGTEMPPELPAASLTEPQTIPEAPSAAKSDCAMAELTSKVVETPTDPSEVERQKVSEAALAETSSTNTGKRKRRKNRALKQAAEVPDEQEFSAEFQSVSIDTQVMEDNTALLQSDDQADYSNTATAESQTEAPKDEDVITEDQRTAILPETPAASPTVVDKTEPASESQTVAPKPEDTIDEDQGPRYEDPNTESLWEVPEHSSPEPLEITVAEVAYTESHEVPIVQDSITEGQCVLNMKDGTNEVQDCNEASGESTESSAAKPKKTTEDETPCPYKGQRKRRRKPANKDAVDNATAKGAGFEKDPSVILQSDVQGESQTEAPKAEDATEDQDVINMEDQTPTNSTKNKKNKRKNKQGDVKAVNVDFRSAEYELSNDPKSSRPRNDYDNSIPAEEKVATKTNAKAQRQANKQNTKAEKRRGKRQGNFEFAQESDDDDFTNQSTKKKERRKKH